MVQQTIISFLTGELDIIRFREMYDNGNEINDFLESIIAQLKAGKLQPRAWTKRYGDRECSFLSVVPYLMGLKEDPGLALGAPPRYTSVRQCLNFERNMMTHDVETAMGATVFYNEVYEIYYQIDSSIEPSHRYSDAYSFALDVIPQYLSGGEAEKYIQKYIIPNFPESMKKGERKRAIKAAIKEAFKSEKGYPAWAQSSEWPMDKTGKPTTYLGRGKSDGELRRYRFRDETTGEIIIIEQFY